MLEIVTLKQTNKQIYFTFYIQPDFHNFVMKLWTWLRNNLYRCPLRFCYDVYLKISNHYIYMTCSFSLDIHTYIHTYQVLVCLIFGTLRTSPFPRSCFSVSEESAQPFGNVALESISFCLYVFPISMIQLCCLSLFVLPCISFFLLKNKSLLLFLI